MRVALLLLAGVAWGQEFEVASIHRASSDAPRLGIATRGGEFKAQNMSVRDLIEHAYDMHSFQLKGGRGWVDGELYSIAAKGAASEAEGREMLKRLLADRFALKLRRESEEQRVYALVGSGKDLTPAKDPGAGIATITPGPSPGSLRVHMRAFQIDTLARVLAHELEQMVIDETGIEGQFDVEFVTERSSNSAEPINFLPALPELGLKLESRRGPVDVYTIEAVERPTEN